ncbi:MAG: NF038130 family PEP-CTERM protein [Nostoc sp. DedQUE12b]|uniref:NF038130 family PEP-CTERM protein n=1 Tax=Nostoc sp. DedQUE12b TaxID=3075398 RepID=UPI002AD45EE1|nr:NF038130 family PEP-CTERM protein [Nostoc sp. DedQUE12b]MDZ8084558.1 NF038130 family PEP-CTERM protein [Nostoc sp. DedQUE12b]
MKMTFQKLVIGASMAIGVSALATAPAHATSFNFNNTGEINTYTGGSNGTFIKGNAQGGSNAAIKALTDNDPTSNVELWYSSETPGSNVGFTATQGKYSATVSSVTANDWNSFGSQWLGDLLNTYTPFKSVWSGFSDSTKLLVTNSFPSLGIGDPNIGSFQFGQNGGVELKLVGHLDVKTKLSDTVSNNLTQGWNGVGSIPGVKSLFPGKTLESVTASDVDKVLLLPSLSLSNKQKLSSFKDLLTFRATLKVFQGGIGASEIAKVVTGGKTYYAYSFNPTVSGITASDDRSSYNAYYTWNTPGYTPTPVPESSVMLGLLGVAGVFVTQRKLKKASI